MNTFIVFSPQEGNKVKQTYPNCFELNESVWVIASEERTCADVCHSLEMVNGNQHRGVVVKFSEFYGLFDRALWERISDWSEVG